MTGTHDNRPLPGAAEPGSLHGEVCRYLAAVDLFRREGCEPRWLGERAEKEALR